MLSLLRRACEDGTIISCTDSSQQSQSLLVLVKLALPCLRRATTESKVAAPSGEAGPSWPRAESTPRAVDAAVAALVDEARPPGIEEQSATIGPGLVERPKQPRQQQSQIPLEFVLQGLRSTAPRQSQVSECPRSRARGRSRSPKISLRCVTPSGREN